MAMRNPPHPGGIVRRQCLEPLGLSVTRAAKGLGVTRQALSELVNERKGIFVEMAIRLAKSFGSTPEVWLRMQMAHDLWQARTCAEQMEPAGRREAERVADVPPRRGPEFDAVVGDAVQRGIGVPAAGGASCASGGSGTVTPAPHRRPRCCVRCG